MKKIIFILFFLTLSSYSSNWWNAEWKYRKEIVFQIPENSEEKTGVVIFKASAMEDGRDIRVVDEEGKEIEFFPVFYGKGNQYQISFPVSEKKYYIYYGNRNAKKKYYNWEPEAGLILEIYRKGGYNGNNWKEAKKTIEKSIKKGLIGRTFVKKVWDSLNPFGPERHIVKIYTGYFYCKTGKYEFATSSDGPSFILIDGKLVADWPGWHRAVPYVKPHQTGSIYLKAGKHKFQYLQLCKWWRIVSVASIKNKKGKFVVIPEKFFIPVYYGKVVKTEKQGKDITADYNWENTHYLRRDKWSLITYKFTDLSNSKSDIIERKWDFGDGQKGNGKIVSHTYLLPGFYNVSLFIRDKNGKTDKITMKVYVDQDYSKTYIPSKKHYEYFKEFKKYDYSKLPYNCLYALSQIYLSYEKIEEASKCYSVLKSKAKTDEERYKFMKILTELLIKTGKLGEAEKLYYEIIEKNPEKIENLLELAELEIEMEKTDEAKEQLDKIMKTKDEKLKRQAEIRMGDIYRIKGDGEKAKKIYEKFTDKKNYSMRNAFYAQQVIYYIKRKDFSTAEEKLKNWGNEVPLAKIDSSWSLLKSRLFFLENRYDKALNEIDIFLKICSKDNPYIPYALFLKGKIYEKKGEKEKAEKIYKEIQKEYPEINLKINF